MPSLSSTAPILVLELLAEIFDERLHHLVVEHLAELGLVPALLELGWLGDRDVALGRVAAAACRSAGRPATGADSNASSEAADQ